MTALRKVSEGQRRQMIADAAYFRAERRGFGDGDPLADWLEAEAEVDARLREVESEHLLEGLEERLAAANDRLKALRKRLSGMKAEAREQWRHDVEKLAKLRDSFEKRLEEIREQGEHASEKARHRAEKIWEDISEIMQRTASRRRTPRKK